MQSTFVLAQLEALPLPEDNLRKAEAAVEKAVKLYHPDFMVFPEVFMSHYPAGTDRSVILGVGEALDGPFVKGMQKLAKENQIWMVFGMREKVEKMMRMTGIIIQQSC
ncbi:nitrilase-related carbon-nitrogen hydrolase [Hungatella sp.]|uniref:nitrilase-related carbon-nitrogen hydrolase n=1 Tax=Hungatella sp. TaxID=2613924 RepID=UPI003995D5CB